MSNYRLLGKASAQNRDKIDYSHCISKLWIHVDAEAPLNTDLRDSMFKN